MRYHRSLARRSCRFKTRSATSRGRFHKTRWYDRQDYVAHVRMRIRTGCAECVYVLCCYVVDALSGTRLWIKSVRNYSACWHVGERCVGSPGRRQIEGPLRPSYGGAASLQCLTLSCLALPFLVLSHPCFIIAPLPCLRILHSDRVQNARDVPSEIRDPGFSHYVENVRNEDRCLGKNVRTREIHIRMSMILDYKNKRREKTRTFLKKIRVSYYKK